MKTNLLFLLLTLVTPTFSKEYVWEHRTGYANGNSFEARLGYTVTGSKRDANLLVASKDDNTVSVFQYQGGTWVSQNVDITLSYSDDAVIND